MSGVLRPALADLGLDRRQLRALVLFEQRIERRIEVFNEELPPLRTRAESASTRGSHAAHGGARAGVGRDVLRLPGCRRRLQWLPQPANMHIR
ncbi:MAG: hypothetical protein JXQ71_00025 [Verrucomicrobia bacterium]|nr:hypothetical protein [Verrucomicrobiota bacterium]